LQKSPYFYALMKKILLIFQVTFLAGTLSAQVLDSVFGTILPTPQQLFSHGLTVSDFPDTRDKGYAALHLTDGRIIMAGHTTGPAGTDFAIVRLFPNGQPDSTLGPNGQLRIDLGYPNDSCLAAVLYGDDRILMGGCVAPAGTDLYNNLIIKTDTDGKVDSTFGVDGKVTINLPTYREMITKIHPLPDGKILIGGNALDGGQILYKSFTASTFVGRLMPEGTIDSTFGINGFLYQVWEADCNLSILSDLAVDTTGAIIITGASYDSRLDAYDEDDNCSHNVVVCRYLANGTPDISFGNGGLVRLSTGNGKGNALLVYSDRRILVAGADGSSSGEPFRTYFARLLPDGSLDSTFSDDGTLQTQTLFVNFGDAAPGNPIGLIQLPGRIVVGVLVSIIPDHFGFGALALTETGRIDSTFGNNGKFVVRPQNAPTSYINNITSTGDNNFFLNGDIRIIGDNTMVIAKIKVTTSSSTIDHTSSLSTALYPNPVVRGELLTIDLSGIEINESGLHFSVLDIYGRVLHRQQVKNDQEALFCNTSNLAAGLYVVRLSQGGAHWQGRFVVVE
jgi:uncharacterized delta-60 repeat protein